MAETVFERIGGEAAVDAAVDVFYEKVLGDDLLAPFFDGIDMMRQYKKQKAFLGYALGAPTKWTGKSMRAAHRGIVEAGASDEHFDRVAGHLVATLEELDVDYSAVDDSIRRRRRIESETRPGTPLQSKIRATTRPACPSACVHSFTVPGARFSAIGTAEFRETIVQGVAEIIHPREHASG